MALSAAFALTFTIDRHLGARVSLPAAMVCRRIGRLFSSSRIAPGKSWPLPFRVLMQPHSIRVKPRDQPFDAFDLRWVSRRTQQFEVLLNPLVYFYARLAHV
jgi:hypothetical protein